MPAWRYRARVATFGIARMSPCLTCLTVMSVLDDAVLLPPLTKAMSLRRAGPSHHRQFMNYGRVAHCPEHIGRFPISL